MGRTGRVYRRVRASFTDKPTFFSWVRPGSLAASGRPFSKGQVDWLRNEGVTAILTLTEEPLPADWTYGVETRHVSMRDHQPPTSEEMRLGADFIADAVSRGKVVLVHCLAGKGRTGCVIAAYMMAYEGRPALQAVDEIRLMREGSVESAQQQTVLEFAETLKGPLGAPRRGTTTRSRA